VSFLDRLRRFFDGMRTGSPIPGRAAEAADIAERNRSAGMRHEEAYRGALRRHEGGDSDGALEMLHEAIQLKHDYAVAHVMIGRIHERLGRIEDASDHYVLGAHHGPSLPEAWLRLGQFAHRRGNLYAARGHLEKAVALQPANAEAHNALGAVLHDLREVEGAYAHFRRAVELKPDFADAHSNLGCILFRDLERLDEGARHIRAALELAPENESALVNWAMVLQHRGDWEASLALCDRLISQNPGLQEVRCNRALILLTRGDFRRGWTDYEARKRLPDFPKRTREWPEWDGSSLSGKSILVYCEQGLGDQIMFASCLPDVVFVARSCVIECNPKLEPLFRRSFPRAQVIGPGLPEATSLPDHVDYGVAMGSLPFHLRAGWSDFPQHRGYLKADPGRVAYWERRLQELGETVKIGISWRGGAPSTRRGLRSIALEEWRHILRCPTARFVSLQHDGRKEELEKARDQHDVVIHCWPDAIEDYDETAALVSALDLVITVQTAVAHLAGALGKMAWVMIPAVPEWRYLDCGDRTPWYPSVRLFRQRTLHEWQPVIRHIRAELDATSTASFRTVQAPLHSSG
jgi:Flp pilus assembly protein TadD